MANRRKRPSTKSAKRPKQAVRITYSDPDRISISYPNSFYLSHTEHEFILTLAEVHPPAVKHMTEDELEALDHVDAIVMARIAFSPGRMRELLKIALANVANWEKSYGKNQVNRQ